MRKSVEEHNLDMLASAIAVDEGKKSQASIGDIREILRIVKGMEAGWLAGQAEDSPARVIRDAAIRMIHILGEKQKKKTTRKKKVTKKKRSK